MSTHFRVTYATLSADNEELHAAYEAGLRLGHGWLGSAISGYVSGKPRTGGPLFTLTSPGDTPLTLARPRRDEADVRDAVSAAATAAPRWARTPWRDRVAVLRAAADLISERSNELAALMSLEVGKNRLEALGDVEEAADLVRYYCQQVEDSDGFTAPMGSLTDRREERQRAPPVRGVGGDQPVQLPDGAGRGPGRGRPGGGEHGRAEAVPSGVVHRGPPV